VMISPVLIQPSTLPCSKAQPCSKIGDFKGKASTVGPRVEQPPRQPSATLSVPMITMMTTFRRLLGNSDATAAVEAAIFLPIFVLLTFGITDLGSAMFKRQQVNAAAQAGAAYAVSNSGGDCASLSSACLAGIQAAMNAAAGSSSFCTDPNACTASMTTCSDGSPTCVTVTASYPLTPILPSTVYSWAQSMTVSYTVVIRIV
jgi:Flp pilus assembly protein TadG